MKKIIVTLIWDGWCTFMDEICPFCKNWCLSPEKPLLADWKCNQGNQDSSGNQKNITQVQKPDMGNRQTQQRK